MMCTFPDESLNLGPLYLSIEAGIDQFRACILDEHLEVIWVERVELDSELSEFRTRNGVHALGDKVTVPSILRIKAFQLVLDKLGRNPASSHLFPRIVAVSGSAPPGSLHFVTPDFSTLLHSLDHSSDLPLSDIFGNRTSSAFSLPSPPTCLDTAAAPQLKQIERHFGTLYSSVSPSSSSSPSRFSQHSVSSYSSLSSNASIQPSLDGQLYFARQTGSKLSPCSPLAQLVKLQESEALAVENGEVQKGVGELLGEGSRTTERILLESGLLSSLLIGSIAPVDAADACSTNLFDPIKQDWEDQILDYVMGRAVEGGGERLRTMLGRVELDGTKSLGTISSYCVERFGFSPETLVVPFTNSNAATALSFPLQTSTDSVPPRRDALVSLSSEESDSIFIASPSFVPDPERQIFLHPAKSHQSQEEEGGGGGRNSKFIAMLTSKDAGLARALARDLYCNGSWDVFTRLTAIVPHGGTLGLDGKQFSFFFPHGTNSFVQGLQRFVGGVKVSELPDRKSNPRLIVENQFLSVRIQVSRLYSSLFSLNCDDNHDGTNRGEHQGGGGGVGRYDPVGFDKFDKSLLPTKIALVGSGSINPAITSILSTILSAPTYIVAATGLERSKVEGEDLEDLVGGKTKKQRLEASGASLGAGYKAAWVYAREKLGTKDTYEEYLGKILETQEESGGGGTNSVENKEENPIDPEKYPISSVTTNYDHTPDSRHRRSSSIYTLASSSSNTATTTHSRNSSIYSSATSFHSSTSSSLPLHPPSLTTIRQGPDRGGGGKPASTTNKKVQQKMYDPADDELFERKPIESDPAGLELVAMPDEHEFKYYSSMILEHLRLQKYVLKGLI